MTVIGIVGPLRSGKDSVAAQILLQRPHFHRVAFADQLKAMALAVDPVIPSLDPLTIEPPTEVEICNGSVVYTARLSQVIRWHGWEYAKDNYPEVRKTLQHLGMGVRNFIGRDAWVDAWQAAALGGPGKVPQDLVPFLQDKAHVVAPDCRFLNEAERIKSLGGILIRVERPSLVSTDTHPSETELTQIKCDFRIVNNGTLEDLSEKVAYVLNLAGI